MLFLLVNHNSLQNIWKHYFFTNCLCSRFHIALVSNFCISFINSLCLANTACMNRNDHFYMYFPDAYFYNVGDYGHQIFCQHAVHMKCENIAIFRCSICLATIFCRSHISLCYTKSSEVGSNLHGIMFYRNNWFSHFSD